VTVTSALVVSLAIAIVLTQVATFSTTIYLHRLKRSARAGKRDSVARDLQTRPVGEKLGHLQRRRPFILRNQDPVPLIARSRTRPRITSARGRSSRAWPVRLCIDQDGGLSALQLQLAVDEVRKIWSEARVAVNSGRYGEPSLPDEATISLRILLTPPP
jgi:hypothetical protein